MSCYSEKNPHQQLYEEWRGARSRTEMPRVREISVPACQRVLELCLRRCRAVAEAERNVAREATLVLRCLRPESRSVCLCRLSLPSPTPVAR